MTNEKLRILVADDHPAFRVGLVGIINQQPDMEVIAEVSDGQEAVDAYRRLLPDVTFLDVRMPRIDGLQALEQIRAITPDAGVIILTTYDLDEDMYKALKYGAMSYLLKDASIEEIVRAIKAVHQRNVDLPKHLADRFLGRQAQHDLSGREFNILELLVAGKTNKEISNSLYISEDTVKTHLKNLFAKLNVHDRTDAVVKAIRRGLVHLK